MFGLPPEMRNDGTATVSRLLVQVARLLAHHASQPAHIPAILLLP